MIGRFYKLGRSVFCAAASSVAEAPTNAEKTKLIVSNGGERLGVKWSCESGGGRSIFHSVWLRRNCQCPQCLNVYNQNAVKSYEIIPRVCITDATISGYGANVRLQWSCGHKGRLNLDWLKRHCYSTYALRHAWENSSPKFLKSKKLPEIQAKELREEQGILRWLKAVNTYGVCLIRDVPCTVEGGLEIAKKISPHLQETFYGGHSVVKIVESPMTLSHGPGYIEPHMDVPMYESPTGLTFLQCVRNDVCVCGGHTIVVDALAVVEKLRITSPLHFATLVRVPATFQRIHYRRKNPVHMTYRTPHIHLNSHGQIIQLRWAPQHEGPLQVQEEDVEPYYEAYFSFAKALHSSESTIQYRLQPGDMMVLNNHRMLHGRTAVRLNGGVRLLNNFSVNVDEFKSCLQVLSAKYDPDYMPKHVLNNDFSYC